MARTEDKRYTRSQEAILTAFREMICEGKTDINVKVLAERAGVHRKTFYLHYTCIEALYQDALSILSEEYEREIDKLQPPLNYYDLTRVMFSFYSKGTYEERLSCDPKYSDFISDLMVTLMKYNRSVDNPYRDYSPEMQNIINAYVTNASMIAFRQWVADGKKVPMQDAINMVSTLLEKGVSAIARRT